VEGRGGAGEARGVAEMIPEDGQGLHRPWGGGLHVLQVCGGRRANLAMLISPGLTSPRLALPARRSDRRRRRRIRNRISCPLTQ